MTDYEEEGAEVPDQLLLSAARADAATGSRASDLGAAPLSSIADLLERHSELAQQLRDAQLSADILRLAAELQDRLTDFDLQVSSGGNLACTAIEYLALASG